MICFPIRFERIWKIKYTEHTGPQIPFLNRFPTKSRFVYSLNSVNQMKPEDLICLNPSGGELYDPFGL